MSISFLLLFFFFQYPMNFLIVSGLVDALQLLHENRLNFCTIRWKRVDWWWERWHTHCQWRRRQRWRSFVRLKWAQSMIRSYSCSLVLTSPNPIRFVRYFSPALCWSTIQRQFHALIDKLQWPHYTHLLTSKTRNWQHHKKKIILFALKHQEWRMRRNFTQWKSNRNE